MARRPIRSIHEVSITRPTDTTQYADGDGVSDDTTTPAILSFTSMVPLAGMGGVIRGAILHKSDQDLTAAAFDLYLFDTTVAVTGFNDNAAIAITDAEWETCIGFIEFAQADGRNVVTGDIWNKTNLDLSYQCVKDSSTIFGVLVAREAYTPGNAEKLSIRLLVETH